MSTSAFEDALAHLQSALRLEELADEADRAGLHGDLGRPYWALGRTE
jgi:hypothetical protein